MQAINIDSGEVVSGDVRNGMLVQELDVYTGEANVFELGSEVELIDNEPFPTELDLDYSDAVRVCASNA